MGKWKPLLWNGLTTLIVLIAFSYVAKPLLDKAIKKDPGTDTAGN